MNREEQQEQRQRGPTIYDELLKGTYRLDPMALIFIGVGAAALFAGIFLRQKFCIPLDTLRTVIIASCILFLLGGLGWVLKLYLGQRAITRVLIATIENAARASKTGKEFQLALVEATKALINTLFEER